MHRPLFSIVIASVMAALGLAQTSDAPIPPIPLTSYVLPSVDVIRFPTYAAIQQTILPRADRAEIARRLLNQEAQIRSSAFSEATTFSVVNTATNETRQIEARLIDQGQHVYVWVQRDYELPENKVRAFVKGFDARVYHQARDLWGSEPNPGVDNDPRIHVLFTVDINPGVSAYFTSQHTYPASIVPDSNEREMIVVNLLEFQNAVSWDRLLSVAAHEFQHMIRHAVDGNEATWIDEGFSMFTERHLGFDDNRWAAEAFMAAPHTPLNHWDVPSLRAASYGSALMFMSYVYERLGLDGIQALSREEADGLEGVDRVVRRFGVAGGADQFFADWVLANALQRPDLGFGYERGWEDLSAPALAASISAYPALHSGEVRQYATQYLELNNLRGLSHLHLDVQKPDEVALIPTTPPVGARFWYSHRGDESNTWLEREFDLSGVSMARMTFRTWFDLETHWDYVYISASADGGQTWQLLRSRAMTADNPHKRNYGLGITGSSEPIGGWVSDVVDLTPYAGRRVLLRFEMITDDALTQPGFALDDVMIAEIGYSADFEADDGGWRSNGFILTDNRLPQRSWIQAVQFVDGQPTITRWMADSASLFRLDLLPEVERVLLAISPFAPLTSVSMPYLLNIAAQ
ncbi:MAG: immune inhibitor A [Anaerolineae bacterium]|nr:immune inhibitor A [Anaerolineae bacterium]MDW8173750.1 immune inhibitor A [Anaerolineae bacterium]